VKSLSSNVILREIYLDVNRGEESLNMSKLKMLWSKREEHKRQR
jgi:hypothetical protein